MIIGGMGKSIGFKWKIRLRIRTHYNNTVKPVLGDHAWAKKSGQRWSPYIEAL